MFTFHYGRTRRAKTAFNLKNVDPVIRYFIISDILMIGAMGLISPIFAIFVVDNIKDAGIEVVGIAQMIYLLTSSLTQVPIASFIDKIKGELDDFWVMLIGSILSSLVLFMYIFVETPAGLYWVQFFFGLTYALSTPTWLAIFSRHLDQKHEGIEWGFYRMLTDLSCAGAAAIGGLVAFRYGFDSLFVLTGILSLLGSFMLIATYYKMRKR